jgi:hypothetical protein
MYIAGNDSATSLHGSEVGSMPGAISNSIQERPGNANVDVRFLIHTDFTCFVKDCVWPRCMGRLAVKIPKINFILSQLNNSYCRNLLL